MSDNLSCSITDCDRQRWARGFCKLHHWRWQHHGDPLYTRPSAEARFWARIKRGADPDACWLWQGPTSRGYGTLSVAGRMERSHRFAWQLLVGPIPDGVEVCHNCPTGDDKRCCNPRHLFLGTHASNMADAANKGQMASGDRAGSRTRRDVLMATRARGERNRNAKLTADRVREIRVRFAAGETQTALAREFGIAQTNVSRIVLRKHWCHIA